VKTLILARNPREAGSYAASMGIPRQHFRAVQKAAAIRGIRNAEVHLLPGFLERRDRHGIMQALRGARHLEIFYVDPADVREPSEATNGSVGPTERELEVAYRYNALRASEDMVSEGGPVAEEPAKPAPKARKPRTVKPAPAAPAAEAWFTED
jgi:hypothetical protein